MGLDFNYRGTLWSVEQARDVMTPIVTEHVDVLITTIEDMALLYGIGCGRYSAEQIVDGDMDHLEDDDIRALRSRSTRNSTPESSRSPSAIPTRLSSTAGSRRRWTPTALSSARRRSTITLWDRLGGGDTSGMPVSTMGC